MTADLERGKQGARDAPGGCSPQGTSQPPGPQAEGQLAALVLRGPTTLAGRVPAESAGRCPQLLENKSVSPLGRLKVTQPFTGDRTASQVLPPPEVCVTLEPWARPGVNSSEAFLRCQWAWLLRLGVRAGNTMEHGYLLGRGDRVRHKNPKASLGLGVPLDVSGPGAFILRQMTRQPQGHPVWIPAMLNKMGIFFYRVYKAASNIEFTWLLQQPVAGKTRCSVCSWGSWGQCVSGPGPRSPSKHRVPAADREPTCLSSHLGPVNSIPTALLCSR